MAKELTLTYTLEITKIIACEDDELQFSPTEETVKNVMKNEFGFDDVQVKKFKTFVRDV